MAPPTWKVSLLTALTMAPMYIIFHADPVEDTNFKFRWKFPVKGITDWNGKVNYWEFHHKSPYH